MRFPFNAGCRITAGETTGRSVPLAAVFSEIAEQVVHHRISREVDERASFAPEGDEVGVLEPVEMERERGTRQPEPVADLADGHAPVSGLHKQAEDIEARFLSEG